MPSLLQIMTGLLLFLVIMFGSVLSFQPATSSRPAAPLVPATASGAEAAGSPLLGRWERAFPAPALLRPGG